MVLEIFWKKQAFLFSLTLDFKKQSLREVRDEWKGEVYGTINKAPKSNGGILTLARQGMDTIHLEN